MSISTPLARQAAIVDEAAQFLELLGHGAAGRVCGRVLLRELAHLRLVEGVDTRLDERLARQRHLPASGQGGGQGGSG
eukprot:6835492-Prymnesium_polylepis.1